jgi:hypothetical protein
MGGSAGLGTVGRGLSEGDDVLLEENPTSNKIKPIIDPTAPIPIATFPVGSAPPVKPFTTPIILYCGELMYANPKSRKTTPAINKIIPITFAAIKDLHTYDFISAPTLHSTQNWTTNSHCRDAVVDGVPLHGFDDLGGVLAEHNPVGFDRQKVLNSPLPNCCIAHRILTTKGALNIAYRCDHGLKGGFRRDPNLDYR